MKQTLFVLFLLLHTHAFAQLKDLGKGITYSIEGEATLSDGDHAPLWLSSNRQGLGSTERNHAYERVGVFRDCSVDSAHTWKHEYGLDLVVNQNAPADFMVHQAYMKIGYKKIGLTIGARDRKIDLRNNQLTSGGLSLGINATPIPQVLAEADYFSVPGLHQWWKWRGRIGFGRTTDGSWQKSWVDRDTRYTTNVLYHEKAVYWKFGREEAFPLVYEIGIQMYTLFGGTSYNITGRNHRDKSIPLEHSQNLNAYWHAFWPMGSEGDVTDGYKKNVSGNHLGSYNMALQWKTTTWSARAYFERFFEDHSMLTVQYGIYDHLIGADATLPRNPFVSHVLVEHLSTKDQSGPVYHDPTNSMPDAIAGIDNYYNHQQYSGWQHWGMAIGNPLLTSPIYNADHTLVFTNNRVQAWHIGMDGQPSDELTWKMLFSFTRNWGSYYMPFLDVKKQQYYLFEVGYAPKHLRGWTGTFSLGIDHGNVVGNNTGVQLRIRKQGLLTH